MSSKSLPLSLAASLRLATPMAMASLRAVMSFRGSTHCQPRDCQVANWVMSSRAACAGIFPAAAAIASQRSKIGSTTCAIRVACRLRQWSRSSNRPTRALE